ncbi:hypothetical protein ACFLY9_02135 [Patescibacteria group bacterium]
MQILYTFVVSIFFSGLFYYLINYALIPYNSENLVDLSNLVIVSIVLIIAIASLFGSVHQFIDKLFFRKFFEKPRTFIAVRRGILLGVLLLGLAWLRIFGFWETHTALLVFVLIILIEALFISFSGGKKSEAAKSESDDNQIAKQQIGK